MNTIAPRSCLLFVLVALLQQTWAFTHPSLEGREVNVPSNTDLRLLDASGWLESAYVCWEPVEGATRYVVTCSGEGLVDKVLDDPLIRSYGTYWRADLPGLAPGWYRFSVLPVFEETVGQAAVTDSLQVLPYDRSGYAFWGGRCPGAYNADGTLKPHAVVLYVTDQTKNTVSLNVTGASSNPCVGLQTILDGFKKGKDNRPLAIRLIGQVTDPDYLVSGDLVIENGNNALGGITLEGIGEDAVADGWGIRLKNASNVEIRNLGSMNVHSNEGDNVGLQQNNDHIWVHHNDVFYGDAGSDADQAKGDGAMDLKRSTYVTFDYNHFWDTGKTHLLGLSESGMSDLYVTYHHNWYDHSDSRHPRVRFYSAHVYNNYYDGVAKYGVGATMGASVFVEGNYFRNCAYPMLISMQGSDVYNPSTGQNDYKNQPTFSKEDGGIIKAFNNVMTGQRRFVPYGAEGFPASKTDFDAYVVTDRYEAVPASVVTAYGSNTYNNFDTDTSRMYIYEADSPEVAREKVMRYAGRINGGDFKWAFNNAVDDTDYEVNQALKTALKNYKTNLVAIQGEGKTPDPDDPENPDDPVVPVDPGEGTVVHNFTTQGKQSTFFTIIGNLSTSKGTVVYEELTLTQCLKMESTTEISFAIERATALTLVFNDEFNGNVKVDDVQRKASNGRLIVALEAGAHSIRKGDIANLFLIHLSFPTVLEVVQQDGGVRLSVNPVEEELQLLTPETVLSVEAVSLDGKRRNMRVMGDNRVHISMLQSGFYVLRVRTIQGVHEVKMLKH